MSMFGDEHDLAYASMVIENMFINRIQSCIERALEKRHLKQSDLAKILNISEARVSQILGGNGKNLQARTVARIAHALDFDPCVEFREYMADSSDAEDQKRNDIEVFSRFCGKTKVHSLYIDNDNYWIEESSDVTEEMVAA